MRSRANVATGGRATASTLRALESLGTGGAVLDVGVGAGASSIPLAPPATLIIGVDTSSEMLEAFGRAASDRGVAAETVDGSWPDVEPNVPIADVVVCHHVLYNVGDLEPFVRALDRHATRRVVIELTERHPLAWMSDLWLHFHGLVRPDGPSAGDAFEAIREIGIHARRETEQRAPRSGGFERREDAVALVRRRLCLRGHRDLEIADALGDRLVERDGLWSAGPTEHVVTTLWWDGEG